MSELTTSVETFSELEADVLRVLSYYAIFKHPLKADELAQRLSKNHFLDIRDLYQSLDSLKKDGGLHQEGQYYMLEPYEGAVRHREEGELRAQKLMKIGRNMARLIYLFPFVRAVLISGSLSKGTVPEDADVDFFIITKTNRLWIARTMLVMFKRFFLLNSKKYFCTNYFVDEQTMEIPDKNIFTATEITTLVPMRGISQYEQFIETNGWAYEYLPNMNPKETGSEQTGIGKKLSRVLLEPLFFHALAERLEKAFMKKTYNRWTKMYGSGYSDQEFELAFRSRRGTSKNHDRNYQKKVLNTIESNMEQAIGKLKMSRADG